MYKFDFSEFVEMKSGISSNLVRLERRLIFQGNYFDQIAFGQFFVFYIFPDGNRVASSTTIDILLRSNFTLKINEDTYNIRVPPQCKSFLMAVCFGVDPKSDPHV